MDDIKKHADKIVSDQLDSYMQHDKPKVEPEVRRSVRQLDLEEDYLGGSQTGRSSRDYDVGEMPDFLRRRKTDLPVARSVRVDEPDRATFKELAQLVRRGTKEAEMSSYVVIKYADLLMRELDNAMECGRLIWKSEKDAFEVKLLLEKVVKDRVLFQTSHGELLPVKVV